MNMKKYFILAAAAVMIAACSNDRVLDYDGYDSNGPVPLKVGAVYGDIAQSVATRSSTLTLQDKAAVAQSGANTGGMGLYIMKQGTSTDPKYDDSSNPTTANTSKDVDYDHFNQATTALTVNSPSTTDKKYTSMTFGSTFYYPDDKGQGLDLYAYSPYSASAPDCSAYDKGIDQTFTITTGTDQKYDADYYANDFLWGCVGAGTTNAAQTRAGSGSNATINATQHKSAKTTSTAGFVQSSQEIIVPMVHIGSKIIVKVKVDESLALSKLEGATVTFYTDKQSGELKIQDGSVTSTTGTSHTGIAIGRLGYADASNKVTVPDTDGDGNTDPDTDGNCGIITDATDPTKYEGYACAGVILPQTVDVSSNSLIEISLPTSPATVYSWKPSANPEFKEGKKYVYVITVKASSISVTTTVADWGVESGTGAYTGDTGNATL